MVKNSQILREVLEKLRRARGKAITLKECLKERFNAINWCQIQAKIYNILIRWLEKTAMITGSQPKTIKKKSFQVNPTLSFVSKC